MVRKSNIAGKSAAGASGSRKSVGKATSQLKASPGVVKATADSPGSRLVDDRIRALGDWRGETLAAIRRMIHEADPEVVEEAKWFKPSNPLGVPVWSHEGIICTGETYKLAVKLTFAKGASLDDPQGLFNSSLDGGTRRAIDIREGEKIDARAFKALVKSAVAVNVATAKKR